MALARLPGPHMRYLRYLLMTILLGCAVVNNKDIVHILDMPKSDDDLKPQYIRLRDSQLEQIHVWRGKQNDLPGKTEAIRKLIDVGLVASAVGINELLLELPEEKYAEAKALLEALN